MKISYNIIQKNVRYFFFYFCYGYSGENFLCDFPFTYLDHELLAKTLQVTNTERGKC